jgi:O-antigen/teichoic acid export membrane protein
MAAATAARQIPNGDWRFLRRAWDWGRIRRAARRYRDFPLFSGSCALLNAMSKYAPVFLLAGFFGPAVAGFYDVSVRVIQAPMNFVLTSLRQVLYQRASEVFRQGGDTRRLFRRSTAALLAVAALPALAVLLFGPRLFAFALGAGWRTAGVYASWMVLWLLFGFAATPAVLFIQVYRKQKPLLFQNAALLVLRVLAIFAGSRLGSPLLAVALCSLVGVLYNLALILWADFFLQRAPQGGRAGSAAP